MGLVAALVTQASADDAGLSPAASSSLGVASGPRADTGLPVGPFMVYPSLFIGSVYNDNLYATAAHRASGWGFRVDPSLNAIDDEGLHKTTLNFSADAQLYPNQNSAGAGLGGAQANQFEATASADHIWSPTPDLTFDLNGGASRQNSVFGSLGIGGSQNFVTSPSLVSVTSFRQYSDVIYTNGSVEKRFGPYSVKLGAGVQDIIYEPAPAGSLSNLSGLDYNQFLRAGYALTPILTGFVEVGGDERRYANNFYDTDAYRVIGGLSSDLIGLFRGEVYAGYQRQMSDNGKFGAVSAPAFGGKVYYYPTRYITMAATLDQSFGSAAVAPANGAAIASAPSGKTVQARFQGDYAMAEYWEASMRAGWARTTYSSSPLQATAWTAGVGLTYHFWRNVGMTLEYAYTRSTSNSALLPGYSQNLVTAGLTYNY